MTLMEILIVAGISSVLSLAISSLLIFSIEQFNVLVQQHKTEEDMLWASYHLRSFFSQSINMQRRAVTTPSCTLSSISTLGDLQDQGSMVSNYGGTGAGSCTPNNSMALIAIFPRENATHYQNIDLFVSAIFYQPPTATGTGLPNPGRLFLDVGERSGGTVHFVPDNTDVVYSGLSDFKVENIELMNMADACQNSAGTVTCSGPNTMIKTAEVTVTFRYFLFNDGKGGQRHDYTINCRTAGANCRDLENVIAINFHNNILTKCKDVMTGCDPATNPAYKERLFGNIYFYKMAIPPGLLRL